jgi:hypothetical protein
MPDREFEASKVPASRKPETNADRTQDEDSPATLAVERDVIERVACRAGDESCATAHASVLSRATGAQPAKAGNSLLQLQKQYGNRYVKRVVALARENGQHPDVADGVENAIHRERGGGHGMDEGVRRQMESSFGANFSGVRLHTDREADTLSRSLSARAFTTGQDIFFRQGAYEPGSSAGRELLAHELTHVVQQNGKGISRAMSVSQPGDPHEVEAEQTARAVMQQEHSGVPKTSEHDQEKDEHHIPAAHDQHALRQPEALRGKDEDEEKKKHHAMKKADEANLSRDTESLSR